eukprot:m.117499 g.117499  ORF g.117499 m.117499 type:complete len:387 (+) comp14251_c0_seq3:345-1505(+)
MATSSGGRTTRSSSKEKNTNSSETAVKSPGKSKIVEKDNDPTASNKTNNTDKRSRKRKPSKSEKDEGKVGTEKSELVISLHTTKKQRSNSSLSEVSTSVTNENSTKQTNQATNNNEKIQESPKKKPVASGANKHVEGKNTEVATSPKDKNNENSQEILLGAPPPAPLTSEYLPDGGITLTPGAPIPVRLGCPQCNTILKLPRVPYEREPILCGECSVLLTFPYPISSSKVDGDQTHPVIVQPINADGESAVGNVVKPNAIKNALTKQKIYKGGQRPPGSIKTRGGKPLRHFCTWPGCTMAYSKASHLSAHLRRHRGEKPYQCEWTFPDDAKCQWAFSRSDELTRHMRSHTGDKTHVCQICSKSFTRSDHLSKHKKIHFKETAPAPN